MADAAALLTASQADSSQQKLQEIKSFKPNWEAYASTQANGKLLSLLEIDAPALKTKHLMQGNLEMIKALLDALQMQEDKPVQWILVMLYEILREDSSCYTIIEDAMKAKVDFYKSLMALMEKRKGDTFVFDKAAWLLSSVIGYLPGYFGAEQVTGFLQLLLGSSAQPGDQAFGTLDAIVNLLKASEFRSKVMASDERVAKHIFSVVVTSKPNTLYKNMFAIWLLAFDAGSLPIIQKEKAIAKIREVLVTSKVEKVVRMSLTALKNLLMYKPLCEEIAESNLFDAVRALDLEKWNNEELYEDISAMVQLVGAQVQEISNFERYEQDLVSASKPGGKLEWNFIHTPKFFGENIMKFEQNEFKVVKLLKQILAISSDPTTLAVACHDIGEFVALHPRGKFMVNKLEMKERVMQLMASEGDDKREIRREALLCCQKIMLNKWQEVDKPN